MIGRVDMINPERDAGQPLNAQIINDGAGRQYAVSLGDGIYMSKDVSNLYLVTTGEGNVLINTGIIYSAAENKRRLDAINEKPVRKNILTQGTENTIGDFYQKRDG